MEPPAPYPVSLVLAGRRCLVVGGGQVAARKVAGLAGAGAHVTVVAPEVAAAIDGLGARPLPGGGTLAVERRPYRGGEAASYDVVLTATGRSEVDRQVAADAGAAGRFVNSADDPEACSFLLPAVHRQEPVTVAVSTGGASPALAAWLRRRIAPVVGPEVAVLARLLEECRRELHAEGRSTAEVDWAALLEGPLPDLVATGRLAEARALLQAAATLSGPGEHHHEGADQEHAHDEGHDAG